MSDSSRKSHGIGAAVDKLFRSIEILIAIFLGAMIFFTFMNVVLRQFGIGFPWSEEIARICFIYLIYLGAIIAARENQHLMIDTLICKLPPPGPEGPVFHHPGSRHLADVDPDQRRLPERLEQPQ